MRWAGSFSTLTKNVTVVPTGAGSTEWKHHLCREDIPACMLFFTTALVYSESEFYIDIKCEFIAAEVRNVTKRHIEKPKIDCPCKRQNTACTSEYVELHRRVGGRFVFIGGSMLHYAFCGVLFEVLLQIRKLNAKLTTVSHSYGWKWAFGFHLLIAM